MSLEGLKILIRTMRRPKNTVRHPEHTVRHPEPHNTSPFYVEKQC
jgi:hypothetical protein